ncbi:MAG: hypothetical protein U0441_26670 [Polyangiaceae bacterium]
MAHQVNYYLLSADLAELEGRLRAVEPFTILHSRSPSAKPKVVESFQVLENGKLWPHLFLVRTEDVGKVTMQEVKAQSYWSIDQIISPVLQFNTGTQDGPVLRAGRLYYQDGFWAPDRTWVEKPEPFRKWAKKLLATAKRMLTKHTSIHYIGAHARAWLASSGGTLEP